jgi:hypothetical protein
MKKILFIGLIASIMTFCKSNPTSAISPSDTSKIKGEYTITSVTYPGQNLFKIKSFDIADSQCFVNSNWSFVANNNTGKLSLGSPKCDFFETDITWYVNKNQEFIFKNLSSKSNPKEVKEGFKLKISDITENSFKLIDKVFLDGNSSEIVYQFNKK